MKLVLAAACAAVVGLGAPAAALAQSGSIDDTLNFIRDQIAAQGQISLAANNRDPSTGQTWTNQTTQEGTNVVVDPNGCQINLHWRTVQNGNVAFDGDGGIPFRLVDHVGVLSLDQYFAHVNVVSGHPNWTTQSSPALTVVTASRPDGVENIFYFADSDLAGRVADAMRHAATLCGGIK
ncbi:MAG TPA: hypothetical protein VKQ70_02880 [Caulobacteraceae bacterium]|nr:hypothetical protein [Caulobacteraceae bacterium]